MRTSLIIAACGLMGLLIAGAVADAQEAQRSLWQEQFRQKCVDVVVDAPGTACGEGRLKLSEKFLREKKVKSRLAYA